MQNRFDWTCYTSRVKIKSFIISFLFHFSLFIGFFLPFPQKYKNIEKEIFIVKLVNIPQIEIPEIKEKKDIKFERNFLPEPKNKRIGKSYVKEEKIEKNMEFSETFSPEEYKKKLYS
ncbi:MAG: hypothetical protein NZ891_06620, partial [bacterium]|nr:hypothetical protein [bacterium]MDW8164398.1 hypothetical protein [Candidatus Omnitrophota bacterium]